MAYESPISVWWSDTKIEQLRDEYDNLIVRAVKNVCPNVDKDELIKALEYDRGQYEKGYRDGRLYQPPVLTNADRLRSMTDEELAEFMCHNVSNGTVNCAFCAAAEFCRMGHTGWLDWLRQEVNE